MPSFRISFSVRTSTLTPSASSALARAANSIGPSMLAGSLTRSRATSTPSVTASVWANRFLAPAGSEVWMEILAGFFCACWPLASFLVLYLSKA